MGIFDRFPYSSTHEMNLDFMLGKATEIAESLQEIDTHKDQAEQAATNAAQSAQSAAQAAQAAAGSQTAAGMSASQAAQHKADAEDAADRAEAASDLADEAVEQAQAAVTQAQTAATNAGTAADGAIASATAAETRINNLAASLPEDFTDLNNEVNDLKSTIDEEYVHVATNASFWTQGSLNVSNGNTVTSSTRIRTGFIDTPNDLVCCENGFFFVIFGYDSDNTYKGLWDGTSFHKPAGFPSQYRFTKYDLSKVEADRCKIILAKDNDNDITPAEGPNFLYLKLTDTTLTLSDKPADAKATGDRLDSLSTQINGSPSTKWYVLGDSISAGYYSMTRSMANAQGLTFDYVSPVTTESGEETGSIWDDTLSHNYWGYANRWKLKRQLVGKARPGQGYYKTASNSQNGVYVVKNNDFSDAGLITVAWGFNDWHYNQPRGNHDLINPNIPYPTENYDIEQITTVNQAIWYCLGELIRQAPNAKIVVQTPMNGWAYGGDFSSNWGIGTEKSQSGTLANIHDDIVYWANYYGLEILDMTYNNSIVNRRNIKDTLIDGSHPSDEAHKQLGRIVGVALKYC